MGVIALIACAGCLWWLARRLGLARDEAILTAAILWGTILTLITEMLSLFHAITPAWLVACWLAAGAIAVVIGVGLGSRSMPKSASPALRSTERWMLGAIGFLVVLQAAVGTISAPSNTDSMTYHLPRVMHWMQNLSVAHFAAAHEPQLYQPPWAEFAILHLQVLTGGDRFAFAVQWLSMLVCAVGASVLARRSGAGPRGQVLAAIFVVSIPGVVFQAYSTQNNLSEGMWLICAASALLALREAASTNDSTFFRIPASGLMFGLCVGLAILTKGTGYILVLPLLAWFVGVAISRAKARGIAAIAVAAIAVVAINLGHWSRNWKWCGSILMPAGQTFLYRARVSGGGLASNVIRNTALNLRTGLPLADRQVYRAALSLQRALGIDANDPAVTFPGHSLDAVAGIGEDASGNPLHLLLLLAAGGVVLAGATRGRRGDAAILVSIVVGGFLPFCLTVKWQMFHARLMVPLFILAGPFVGLALEQFANRTVANWALGAALVMAFGLVVVNPSHPLIGPRSIFRQPREAQYFANRPALYEPYRRAADLLAERGCTHIGITTGPVGEYPLWVMMHSRAGRWPRIVPVTGSVADQPCAVLALPAGQAQEGSMPVGIGWTFIPLGRGVTIALKPPPRPVDLKTDRSRR